MDIGPPGSSGDGSDSQASLSDYLDPDADTLLGKVDLAGMVGSLYRGWVLGVFSAATGFVIATKRSIGNLYEDITDAYSGAWNTLTSFPSEIQEGAVEAAAQQLQQFGILAGPVSQAVVLAGIGFAVFVLVVIILGGDG